MIKTVCLQKEGKLLESDRSAKRLKQLLSLKFRGWWEKAENVYGLVKRNFSKKYFGKLSSQKLFSKSGIKSEFEGVSPEFLISGKDTLQFSNLSLIFLS